jgi:predicted aspartyl protease
MGMVTKTIRIRGDRGARAVEALFDTGASKSLIRRDVARRVGRLLRSPTA